jgi:hypothetical protein
MDDTAAAIPTERHGRLVTCGRSAGYLRERTEQLLVIARVAGAGWISWA